MSDTDTYIERLKDEIAELRDDNIALRARVDVLTDENMFWRREMAALLRRTSASDASDDD